MHFKVFKNIELDKLEETLNDITKNKMNVVQVLPVNQPAYAGSLSTNFSIVAVGGQPWNPTFEEPAKSEPEKS